MSTSSTNTSTSTLDAESQDNVTTGDASRSHCLPLDHQDTARNAKQQNVLDPIRHNSMPVIHTLALVLLYRLFSFIVFKKMFCFLVESPVWLGESVQVRQ